MLTTARGLNALVKPREVVKGGPMMMLLSFLFCSSFGFCVSGDSYAPRLRWGLSAVCMFHQEEGAHEPA
jgi:hypothetical protein